MARPIPASSLHHLLFSSMPITVFVVLVTVLSIFSVVTFLCGSKRKKKFQAQMEEDDTASHSKSKRFISKLNSNLSDRALSMVKMMSWRKVQAEEEEEEGEGGNYVDDNDEAFWRKSILMGERCRPLDHSGKTVYDSQGNMVLDLSHKNGHH